MDRNVATRVAQELNVQPKQVAAAMALLDDGATVPFVARYRKEATGGLDDGQLRTLEERVRYLRELDERRDSVLASIDEQGKLDDTLRRAIIDADTKQRLEDLYLPYRKKRRTKAQIAREAGLEPLADSLLNDPQQTPESAAEPYLGSTEGVATVKDALDGAKQILMERFSEQAELVGTLRERLWEDGVLVSQGVADKKAEGAKFSDYFEHQEPLNRVPSHRALAMFRGRNEGVLALKIDLDNADESVSHPAEGIIARHAGITDQKRPADTWLKEVVRWTWRVKLYTQLETELLGKLRERAELEAITVFAENLNDLLLAAPAGAKPTLGLDPGLRTGIKVAAIDATGKVVAHDTLYPHAPQKRWDQARAALIALCEKFDIELIAIGNGTASRETDKLAGEVVAALGEKGRSVSKVVVSEAGASVYSASELAAQEFPDLDVTIRGAISIARRLQDPLAELVKIDPKSIGVGQYQHDVSQLQLSRSLDAVVEDCVNGVGVDLNTASSALLKRVSGLNANLADNIVAWRDQNGAFGSRTQLLKVGRLGPKTFEQCAGFLRISNGDNPLDGSAVHPEAYPVVERIAKAHGRALGSLVGDAAFLGNLRPAEFTDERFGLPTVTDILKELVKPGRDPRPEFRFAEFQEGVETLNDLEPGMILEGAVTNVTHFGAFVDIGVHQDGLVHISALSDRFVKDPREVVKAGDIVRVKVMEIDLARKRVGLSMRLNDTPEAVSARGDDGKHQKASARSRHKPAEKSNSTGSVGALGEALLKAGAKRQ
ncbi:Tex family protein [Larsenimonas suaedae]|uniref:Tex family protein n=1 Tax=Larsenimonas suaedae TaxID=1851019 RepID=A0ABU1GY53_9GAMM|nr:Tex family protein [Larsenimonas suaedae]MCM2972945.1 RNA-binding transcriptional accessory protein [Larsenimonas suaedae]MDR5896382.1 Tex family protein [Larsenimonas suaedae]